MNQSESITELAPALVSAQSAGLIVIAENKNTQTNSKYANLADIAAKIIPILTHHGVAVLQFVGMIRAEGMEAKELHVFGVCTRLLHSSGQWIEHEGEFPLAPPPVSKSGNQILNWSQNHGLAITYARRYALVSALGIATGDDDDAQKLLSALQTGTGQEPVYTPHWSDLIRGKWDGELIEGYNTPLGEMSDDEKAELVKAKVYLKSPALTACLWDRAIGMLGELDPPQSYEDRPGTNWPVDFRDLDPAGVKAFFNFAKLTHQGFLAAKTGEAIP